MTPVVASLPVRELLLGPVRDVRVRAVFPHAAYLEVVADVPTASPPTLITLVTSDGVAHPNALIVRADHLDRPFASLHQGQVGCVGQGTLVLGDADYRPARWRSAVPSLPAVDPDRLASASVALRTHLEQRTGPLPADLAVPAAAVAAGVVDGDVEVVRATAVELIGWGPGLTPSGDDVLAGVLAGLRALASAVGDVSTVSATLDAVGPGLVQQATGRTTDVSLALLDHATRGEVAAPAGTLLQALATHTPRRATLGIGGPGTAGPRTTAPAPTALAAATDHLLAVGSTSGRDLTIGLLAAAERLVHRGGGSPELVTVAPGVDGRARPPRGPSLVPA